VAVERLLLYYDRSAAGSERDENVLTQAEKEDQARARQLVEHAKATQWPTVDKFEGTSLVISDDYGFICMKVETLVGGSKKRFLLEPAPCHEVDAAQAELMVLTAIEWVSEQHRA